MAAPVVEQYKQLIRRTLDLVGVSGSIERKVLAAVGLQFGASVGLAVVAFTLTGLAQFVLTALLLTGAVVAFANTVFITREDMVDPIVTLSERADRIAAGEIDVDVPDSEREDEVASLLDSFGAMQTTLATVARQADALAAQEFDDQVLDEDVPGTFGESLSRMATNMADYTTELQEMTDDLENRSAALSELVTAFGDAAEQAKAGDLTATIDAEFDGVDDQFQQVVTDYNDLLRTLAEDPDQTAAAAVEGEVTGAKRDVILANAGAAIYVAGEANSIADGVEQAANAIDTGAAGEKLATLVDTDEQPAEA